MREVCSARSTHQKRVQFGATMVQETDNLLQVNNALDLFEKQVWWNKKRPLTSVI